MAKCSTLEPCGTLLLIAATVLLLATSSASAAELNAQKTNEHPKTTLPLIGGRRSLQQVG
jgi:hypothetical protein